MTVFAVFGAGSIGCYVGGRLLAGGAEVVFIGRPKIAEIVEAHGLKLTDYLGQADTLKPDQLNFHTTPEVLNTADVILVCVKSMATAEAAAAIEKHAKKSALVISLQNGVSNAAELRQHLSCQPVAGGMVPYNVVNLGEGHFHRGTTGDIIVEDVSEAVPAVTEMAAAGLPTEVTPNIDGVLWGKVLINLNNALNMLSDMPLRQELLDIHYRKCWALCIREGLEVLSAAGIKPVKSGNLDPVMFVRILGLPNFILLRIARGLSKVDEKARSSMWEDLQAGREPEIDYINGALVDLGRKVGVPTPVNDRMVELVNDAFKAGSPPAFNGNELLRMLRT